MIPIWLSVVAIVVAAALAVLWWRDRRALERTRTQLEQLTLAVDQIDAGIVIYDRNDRIAHASPSFKALYPALTDQALPGNRFEDLMRAAVEAKLTPESQADPQAWLAERLRAHAEGGTFVRELANGQSRRVTEKRLSDGGMVTFSVDLTELMRKGQALEQARAMALAEQQRLEDAIEAVPAGVAFYDAEDRLILCNKALREMWPNVALALKEERQPTFESLLRRNIASGFIKGVDANNAEDYVARRLAQRQQPNNQLLMRNGDQWLRTYERRLRDGGIASIWADVTEGVVQREATEAARARLQDAIDALPAGFALFDQDDHLVICNARYIELNPESAPAVIAGNSFEAMLRYGIERQQYPQASGDAESWIGARLAHHRQPDGELTQEQTNNHWLRISERKTRDGGTATVITDVTEMIQREQALQRANGELDAARARLEQLSDTDGLTGIANRRLLDRRLVEEWQRSRRQHEPLALLIVDVDHFKRFNDRHGHLHGDTCLRRVAELLQGVLHRSSDLVARYGGEEFVILLPHTDLAGAQRVAAECLAAIDEAKIEHADSPVSAWVTISIGCSSAVVPADGGDPQALLGVADAALFRAKQGGRHQVCAADPL